MVEEIRSQEVRGEGLCIFLVSGPGTALVDDQLHDQDCARGTLPKNSWRRVPRHTSAPPRKSTYQWSFALWWGRLAALNALQRHVSRYVLLYAEKS